MTVPDEIDALLMKAEDFEVRAMISDQALYQAAAKEYEKAAELSEGYYGDLREETLNIRDRWAVSLRNAGDLGKAITCDLSNLDWSLEYINRCLSRHGDNGALVLHAKQRHLNVQRRLAESYLEDKQYAEAIQRFKAVVDTNMPRSAEQICEARVDQASALFESGTDRNIMEAVNMNMVTLQRAETDLGSDHIETIKVRYNLGAELYALKKYDDALMKFGELLEILQTDYCRAKSSPDYEEYLNDAETFLLNCSAKIARRDEKIRLQAIVEAEEKARNEELENQLAEQQIVEQQVREAMAREEEMVRQQSAVEAEDRKRKEELERHLADLMEVQEAKRRQRRLEAENAAKEAAEKERQKKAWLDRLDQERRDQAKRARARKDVATAISNVIGKWTNDGVLGEQAVAQNMPSQQISPSKASPGVGAEEYFASPGTTSCSGEMIYVDCEDKVDVVGTTADNEEPSEMTTHSGSICNTSHRPDLTKADLLQVQHVEALSTETVGDQSNEEPDLSDSTTKSIRSEATVGAAMIPGNVTEKLEVENEVLEEQEQQFADNPSMAEAQRVPVTELNNGMRIVVAERLTKIPELWQELRRKNTFELFAAASRSKSKPENCPRSVFGSARSTAIESGSRRHSAPSTKLPELGASIQRGNLEYVHGHPNVISKAHEPVENERPESPQSDYRTASPSSPARRPSSTEDINERLQHETFGELHKTLVSVSSSGSAGVADSMEASPDQVQDHVVSANSKTSNLAKRSLENPMLSLTSLGDTWSTSSPIEDTSLRGIVAEVSGTDDTTSEAEVERLVGKQSQPVTPSMLFSAVRTDTLKSNSSERNVPGGWHQDFDEPETVRSLRRSRSSDQQGGGGLRISQTEDTYHRRASSVGLSGASMPETPTSPIRNWSHQDEIIADEWFERLRSHAHALLDKYKEDSFTAKKAERRVKIAVLDTGVAKSSANGPVPLLMKGPRVRLGKQMDPSLPWNIDTKGHGTHAAGLILTVCPYADVYVYRVCEGNETASGIDRKHVVDAISDAVDKKKVDIISMSLGWEDNSHRELQATIRRARDNNVLLFAASSNEGIRTKAGMAYPARALEVIAVDAADVHGNPSKFNPPQTRDKARFTALGEAVRSTYPMHLPSEDPEPGWKRMVGTSCATPIAAGIAGLVLEFARQRPLCFDSSIEAHLKSVEGMRLILTKCLSLKYAENSPFNHLDPTMLFHCTERSEDGGGWSEYLSPRFKAAYSIVTKLSEEFSPDIGLQMARELEKELATSPRVRTDGGKRSWFR